EGGATQRAKKVHPELRGPYRPGVADSRDAVGLGELPHAGAFQLAGRASLETSRRFAAGQAHVESEVVGQLASPHEVADAADATIVNDGDRVNRDDALPPGRPCLAVKDRFPDAVDGRTQTPDSDELIVSHRVLRPLPILRHGEVAGSLRRNLSRNAM